LSCLQRGLLEPFLDGESAGVSSFAKATARQDGVLESWSNGKDLFKLKFGF